MVNGMKEEKIYLKTKAHIIFTWYTFKLMQDGVNFTLFLDNNQILSDREYQEWIKENGIINDTIRINFYKFKDGYRITKTDCILNLTVPNDLLKMKYVDFMEKI